MDINQRIQQVGVNIQEKAALIWNVANSLFGAYKPHEYGLVILPMVVVKRFHDCLLPYHDDVVATYKRIQHLAVKDVFLRKAAGNYRFYNTSEYTFEKLKADPDNIKVNFEDYLNGFSDNIIDILARMDFFTQVERMANAGLLYQVISDFCAENADMNPEKISPVDMGYIFENLVQRFSESYDEEAGAHFTSRDIIYLMCDLLTCYPANEKREGQAMTVYDMAMGTSQMLTCMEERMKLLDKEAQIICFGQEINPFTYGIAKADMLIRGGNPENMQFGDTLNDDKFGDMTFDYIISNPPFGIDWKREAADIEKEAKLGSGGRFGPGLPSKSDGQLLFLLNNVAKMKKDTPLGSRIAEVHNGSSIFTGDAGSGESNARRYMIENDLVEAIIAVPENMFYNTGIGTFIWVLSNKKEDRRKGKIQLIDATAMKSALRKNMGKKNCEFTEEIRKEIVRMFLAMEESEVSIILNNEDFGYWNVTVERPLRLRVYPDRAIPADTFKKSDEYDSVMAAIEKTAKTAPLDDWTAFAKATKLKAAALKKVRPFITEKDPTAQPIEGEPDVDLRDTENIPFTYAGGIDAFMKNEVLTYAPDAWVDEKKTQIGYEISFTKYFYKPVELRDMSDILSNLSSLEQEADGLLAGIMEGVQ